MIQLYVLLIILASAVRYSCPAVYQNVQMNCPLYVTATSTASCTFNVTSNVQNLTLKVDFGDGNNRTLFKIGASNQIGYLSPLPSTNVLNLSLNGDVFISRNIQINSDVIINGFEFYATQPGLVNIGIAQLDCLTSSACVNNLQSNGTASTNFTKLSVFSFGAVSGFNQAMLTQNVYFPAGSCVFFYSNQTQLVVDTNAITSDLKITNGSQLSRFNQTTKHHLNIRLVVNQTLYTSLFTVNNVYSTKGVYPINATIPELAYANLTSITVLDLHYINASMTCPDYVIAGVTMQCLLTFTCTSSVMTGWVNNTYDKINMTFNMAGTPSNTMPWLYTYSYTVVKNFPVDGIWWLNVFFNTTQVTIAKQVTVVSDTNLTVICNKSALVGDVIFCRVDVSTARLNMQVGVVFGDGTAEVITNIISSNVTTYGSAIPNTVSPVFRLNSSQIITNSLTITTDSFLNTLEFFADTAGILNLKVVNVSCANCASITDNDVDDLSNLTTIQTVPGANVYTFTSRIFCPNGSSLYVQMINTSILLDRSTPNSCSYYLNTNAPGAYALNRTFCLYLRVNATYPNYTSSFMLNRTYTKQATFTVAARAMSSAIYTKFDTNIFYLLLITLTTAPALPLYTSKTYTWKYTVQTIYNNLTIFNVDYNDDYPVSVNVTGYSQAAAYQVTYGRSLTTFTASNSSSLNRNAYYLVSNAEIRADIILLGFNLIAESAGSIQISIINFLFCGTNIACTNYLSANPANKYFNSDYSYVRSWSYNVTKGTNKFLMNEVIHLEPGSMVVWSSLNGSGFISYQSSTTIRDFKFENDSLVPVNGFFAVNILGELYKKTLTINAVKTFAYPGTYPIVSYFLYFVQKLTASTYVTDDPILTYSCTNLIIWVNQSVNCQFNYFAQVNFYLTFNFPQLNFTDSYVNATKNWYMSYFGGFIVPIQSFTLNIDPSDSYLLLSAEFLNTTELAGFQVNARQSGSVQFMMVTFANCGGSITCGNYFNARTASANSEPMTILDTYTFNMSPGNNTYNVSQVKVYQKGTVVLMKLPSGQINQDANYSKYFDQLVRYNQNQLFLNTNQRDFFRFCVKILTNRYYYTVTDNYTKQFNLAGNYTLLWTFYDTLNGVYYKNTTYPIRVSDLPLLTTAISTTTNSSTTSTWTTFNGSYTSTKSTWATFNGSTISTTSTWATLTKSNSVFNSNSFNATTTVKSSNVTSVSQLDQTTSSYSSRQMFGYSNLSLVLSYLTNYTDDLSSCLVNCSNNGFCEINLNGKLVCRCGDNYSGSSCDTDIRPCSQNPCLNNGTCIQTYNASTRAYNYQCLCNPQLNYGLNCQNTYDLCANQTCSSSGNCVQNGTQTSCKCFYLYEGDNCELTSESLKFIKNTITTASIIAILTVIVMYYLFMLSDMHTYYINVMDDVKAAEMKEAKKHRKKRDHGPIQLVYVN